jgi:hypothetical protein
MGSPNRLEQDHPPTPDFISRLLDSQGQTAEEIKALLERLGSPEVDATVADQLCRIFLGKIWLPVASTLWKLAEGEYPQVRVFDKLLSEPPYQWSNRIIAKDGPTFERVIRQLFQNCLFGEQLGDITPGNIVMVYTKLRSIYGGFHSATRIFPTVRVVRIEEPSPDRQITLISMMSKLWQFDDGKYDLPVLSTPETLESSLCGHSDRTRQLWHEYSNTIRLTDLRPPQG